MTGRAAGWPVFEKKCATEPVDPHYAGGKLLIFGKLTVKCTTLAVARFSRGEFLSDRLRRWPRSSGDGPVFSDVGHGAGQNAVRSQANRKRKCYHNKEGRLCFGLDSEKGGIELMAKTEKTSAKVASKASKLLSNPSTPKSVKSVAASALTQAPNRK